MEQQSNMRIITLKDLWRIFVQRFLIIVLAAVVCMGTLFIVSSIAIDEKYESTATLYILRQNENANNADMSSDFSLALNVVNDCTYLLKSHAVIDKVIEELALDISYDEMTGSVSTYNPDNTRILEVTVESDTPAQAKKIVDSVCSIGAEKITQAMGFDQVYLYEYGTLESEPSNNISLLVYLLVGIAAAVLAYTVCLIAYLIDDRIRSEEDIERYLGLTLLGDIPDANDSGKNKYGYSAYYGKKQSGKSKKNKKGAKIWKWLH